MVRDRWGRKRMVEDERGGGGNVANVQVLPVSNVANFQLWAVGARAEAAASPRCGALVCASLAFVLCLLSSSLCPLSFVFCPERG